LLLTGCWIAELWVILFAFARIPRSLLRGGSLIRSNSIPIYYMRPELFYVLEILLYEFVYISIVNFTIQMYEAIL